MIDKNERWISALRSTAITNLLIVTLGLFTTVLIARSLGPQGNGDLSAIRTIPLLVGSIAVLGMPDAIVYFTSKSKSEIGATLTMSMAIALLSSLLLGLVTLLSLPYFLADFSPSVVITSQLFVLIGPLMATVGVLIEPLRASSETLLWNALRILPSILWTVIVIYETTIGTISAVRLAIEQLVITALVGIPFAIALWRKLRPQFVWNLKYIPRLLRFGIPSMLVTLPTLLNSRVDLVVVTALSTPTNVGIYAVAISVASVVSPAVMALGQIALPKIAAIRDPTEAFHKIESLARANALLVFIVTVPAIVATPLLLPIIFGIQFQDAVPIACILLISTGIAAYNFNIGQGIRGLGNQRIVILSQFLGVLICIIGAIILFAAYGSVGAAIGSILGNLSTSILLIHWWTFHHGGRLSQFLIPSWREILLWVRSLAS